MPSYQIRLGNSIYRIRPDPLWVEALYRWRIEYVQLSESWGILTQYPAWRKCPASLVHPDVPPALYRICPLILGHFTAIFNQYVQLKNVLGHSQNLSSPQISLGHSTYRVCLAPSWAGALYTWRIESLLLLGSWGILKQYPAWRICPALLGHRDAQLALYGISSLIEAFHSYF